MIDFYFDMQMYFISNTFIREPLPDDFHFYQSNILAQFCYFYSSISYGYFSHLKLCLTNIWHSSVADRLVLQIPVALFISSTAGVQSNLKYIHSGPELDHIL